MKTILYFSITIFLSLGCMSCDNDKENGEDPKPPMNKKSYIQGFFELNDMHISPMSGFLVNKKNNSIKLDGGFDAPKVYEISDGIGISIAIGSEGLDKGLINWKEGGKYTSYYNELVEKIGDTSYNSEIMEGISAYGSIVSVADTLQSINITCNKQFDESHPSGNNLNDIFSVYVEDPVAVIKNGYKTVTGSNYYSISDMPKEFPYCIFGSKLSSVDLINKPYIGIQIYLVLDAVPERTGEYIFTISVINKQGKIIKKTAAPMQIKGLW
jgi:hypothetical protein